MKRILITLLAIVLVANFAFSAEGAAAAEPAQPEAAPAAPAAAAPAKTPVKIDIFGGVRYRFQYDSTQSYSLNNDGSYNVGSTTTKKERQRIKVQLGARAQIGDQVEAKIVLSTGNGTSNTRSVNQTIGADSASGTPNVSAFGEYNIYIYEAELKLKFLSNMLQIGFGKFKAPHYATDLIIYSDVRPDGMYQTLDVKLGNMNIGLNLGEWVVLKEFNGVTEGTGSDAKKSVFSKWIIAPQLFWKANFGMIDIVLAPGMYIWTNRDRSNGEILYSLLSVYFELGFKLAIPIKLKFEMSMNMSKNEGFTGMPWTGDADAVKNKKMALLVELSAGSVKKQWDWELKVGFVTAQLYAVNPITAWDDLFKVTGDKVALTTLNTVMPCAVPMAIYVSAGLGVLDNTKLTIDFVYFQQKYYSAYTTTAQAAGNKGWILKMSLEAKF